MLDEADRMLDMGFIRDIKKILALLPKKRQNLLFSATFSDEIKALPTACCTNPAVEVARRNTASELIAAVGASVNPGRKKRELLAFLIQRSTSGSRCWCSPHQARRQQAGRIPRQARHPARGDPRQQEPVGAHPRLADFKDAKLQVLVATDIAARGLDIDQPPGGQLRLPNVPKTTCTASAAPAAPARPRRRVAGRPRELPLLKDIERRASPRARNPRARARPPAAGARSRVRGKAGQQRPNPRAR